MMNSPTCDAELAEIARHSWEIGSAFSAVSALIAVSRRGAGRMTCEAGEEG
jgi:hypothetical protein